MKILTIPNDNIIRVCNLLNQLIGDVTSKNLFTGYGLFHKDKDMFAVWINNKVYGLIIRFTWGLKVNFL